MKSDLWGEHRRISDRFGIAENTQKTNRRTMADRHMRRSACWKAGESEVICLHGGPCLCRPYIGRMAKKFRPVLGFFQERKRFRSLSNRVSFPRG